MRTLARASRLLAVLSLVVPAACGGGGTSGPSPGATTTEPPPPSVEVEGDAPTTENLAGIWRHATQPLRMIRFGPGDGFVMDTHATIDSTPSLSGTYAVEDRDIVVTVSGIGPCDAGDSWTWRAGVPEDGRLTLVFIRSGHGNCSMPIGTEWPFVRLSPTSAAGADITVEPVEPFAPLPADPEAALEALDGLWLLGGGGHLLRLRPHGTYAIDDIGLLGSDPYDAGSIEVDGSTLALVSTGGSNRCAEGDRLVLRDVELDGVGRTLRAVVEDDACEHGLGTTPTLIKLSL